MWDECSMGGVRRLELFHEITSQFHGNKYPFAGIQIIFVGGWLKLTPVIDKFDDGKPMYLSSLFHCFFPQKIKQTIVHQQNERDVL